MAIDLGKIGIVPKGEFTTAIYEKLDLVTSEGSSYVSLVYDNDAPLSDTTKWQLVASKGDAGQTGPQGPQGETGFKTIDPDPITPTDPSPTVIGWYKPTISSAAPGTNYPNAGNLKAISGFDTLFYFDGTTWVKVETEIDKPTQNIPLFSELVFPVNPPTQTIYNDIHWLLVQGPATAADIPSDTSTKWERIGDAVLSKVPIVTSRRVDTYTTNQYFVNANAFSGFGFDYGVQNDFNQVIIKVGQIVGTSNPFTQVNLRICENTYQGTELARINKTVSIAEGDIQDVTFDLPSNILNSTNQNIWIEFWVNGKTGLFKGNIATNVNYRYKTVTMSNTPTTGFDIQSTASSTPNFRFYLVLNKVTYNGVIKDSLISNKVEIGDQLPVKSDAVAQKFAQYDTVITDGFHVSDSVIKGNTNVNVQTSTFKGWGQLLGVLTNFNRVGYIFRAFDASMIPTKVKCVIRTGSNTGPIIFSQTKNVTLVLNTNKTIYFDLPSIYQNTLNEEIFVSYFADGMIALVGGLATSDFDAAHVTRYSTAVLSDTANASVTNLRYQMYCEVLRGELIKQISDSEVQRIAVQIGGFDTPDLILTSRAWLYPGFQYNIYDENVLIPKYGDNNSNYRLNFDGTVGKQTARGFRLDNIGASLNTNITLSALKGRTVLTTQTQNLLSGTTNNGAGNNRKVLTIGDSTVNGGNISIPLKAVFDADIMDITLIGTLGSAGLKHEGRGGWRIVDYYGQGRLLYQIEVSGINVAPGINARYTQGANTYNVDEVNISGGSGYFSVSIVTGSAPLASGTLTKSSGTGDSSISYTTMTPTPGNPFYYATTGKFDLGYYLTSTGQTMIDNDWIFFQLGINDVFSSTDLTDASTRSSTMLSQLNEMITNIHTYNANIRIGLVITIPPADQNAFGESYTVGQLSEMYRKTGLVTWQKTMLGAFDNIATINSKTYLVSANLNIDTRNNFQTTTRPVNSRNTTITETVQSNGVHPASSGYAQIADMYAGLIKYFG